MARDPRGLAYSPPTSKKQKSKQRGMALGAVIVIVALVALGVFWFTRDTAPDRSGEGAAAVENLLTAEVLSASGTVRSPSGTQHQFTADLNTTNDTARGLWSGEDSTRVTYVVTKGSIYAAVNPASWKTLGLNNAFQGWASLPESILGTTPVTFTAAGVRESVKDAPTKIDGDEFTYPSGTVVSLRNGHVSTLTYKGTTFSLEVPEDANAGKRISDAVREAESAKVATVNETENGTFAVVTPPPPPAPPKADGPSGTPSPSPAPRP